MDLKKFDTLNAVEKPQKFIMKDWDDEDTDISFTIYGVGSKVYEKYHSKLERAQKRAKGKELSVDETNELWIDILANCIVAWENVEEDGKAIEFNYDNAVDLLTRYPYFRNSILAQMMDVRAFLQS